MLDFTYLFIGMQGGPMKDAINNNFNLVNDKFNDVDKELAIRIISNQIQEIRYDGNEASFTVDGGNTWIPLSASWGAIEGDILDQTDLIEYLTKHFADKGDFNTLKENVAGIELMVQANENNITNLLQDVSTINETLYNQSTGLVVRVGNLEDLTKDMVHSPNIHSIQFNIATGEMEYSEDGEVYVPMKTIQEWGDLQGDIQNQSDLWLLIKGLQDRLKDLEENLNDNSFTNMNEMKYENLTEKKSNVMYNITDINF